MKTKAELEIDLVMEKIKEDLENILVKIREFHSPSNRKLEASTFTMCEEIILFSKACKQFLEFEEDGRNYVQISMYSPTVQVLQFCDELEYEVGDLVKLFQNLNPY